MKIFGKFIATIVVCTFSFGASAAHIYYSASGSEDGVHYDKVIEEHNGVFNQSHSLICKDPGNTVCGWQYPPSVGGNQWNTIYSYVTAQVANGNNSGNTNLNGTATVKWSYDPQTDLLEIWAND